MVRIMPVLATMAALALVAGGTGPAAAAWYDDLDLTLLPRGPEEPFRLAVPGSSPQLRGRLLPYFSLGTHGLVDEPGEDPSHAPRYHNLADPASPRLDVGAGLTLRLFDRLYLYGEYRFFQSRPSPSLESPRRESDGPTLRGGFSIPF